MSDASAGRSVFSAAATRAVPPATAGTPPAPVPAPSRVPTRATNASAMAAPSTSPPPASSSATATGVPMAPMPEPGRPLRRASGSLRHDAAAAAAAATAAASGRHPPSPPPPPPPPPLHPSTASRVASRPAEAAPAAALAASALNRDHVSRAIERLMRFSERGPRQGLARTAARGSRSGPAGGLAGGPAAPPAAPPAFPAASVAASADAPPAHAPAASAAMPAVRPGDPSPPRPPLRPYASADSGLAAQPPPRRTTSASPRAAGAATVAAAAAERDRSMPPPPRPGLSRGGGAPALPRHAAPSPLPGLPRGLAGPGAGLPAGPAPLAAAAATVALRVAPPWDTTPSAATTAAPAAHERRLMPAVASSTPGASAPLGRPYAPPRFDGRASSAVGGVSHGGTPLNVPRLPVGPAKPVIYQDIPYAAVEAAKRQIGQMAPSMPVLDPGTHAVTSRVTNLPLLNVNELFLLVRENRDARPRPGVSGGDHDGEFGDTEAHDGAVSDEARLAPSLPKPRSQRRRASTGGSAKDGADPRRDGAPLPRSTAAPTTAPMGGADGAAAVAAVTPRRPVHATSDAASASTATASAHGYDERERKSPRLELTHDASWFGATDHHAHPVILLPSDLQAAGGDGGRGVAAGAAAPAAEPASALVVGAAAPPPSPPPPPPAYAHAPSATDLSKRGRSDDRPASNMASSSASASASASASPSSTLGKHGLSPDVKAHDTDGARRSSLSSLSTPLSTDARETTRRGDKSQSPQRTAAVLRTPPYDAAAMPVPPTQWVLDGDGVPPFASWTEDQRQIIQLFAHFLDLPAPMLDGSLMGCLSSHETLTCMLQFITRPSGFDPPVLAIPAPEVWRKRGPSAMAAASPEAYVATVRSFKLLELLTSPQSTVMTLLRHQSDLIMAHLLESQAPGAEANLFHVHRLTRFILNLQGTTYALKPACHDPARRHRHGWACWFARFWQADPRRLLQLEHVITEPIVTDLLLGILFPLGVVDDSPPATARVAQPLPSTGGPSSGPAGGLAAAASSEDADAGADGPHAAPGRRFSYVGEDCLYATFDQIGFLTRLLHPFAPAHARGDASSLASSSSAAAAASAVPATHDPVSSTASSPHSRSHAVLPPHPPGHGHDHDHGHGHRHGHGHLHDTTAPPAMTTRPPSAILEEQLSARVETILRVLKIALARPGTAVLFSDLVASPALDAVNQRAAWTCRRRFKHCVQLMHGLALGAMIRPFRTSIQTNLLPASLPNAHYRFPPGFDRVHSAVVRRFLDALPDWLGPHGLTHPATAMHERILLLELLYHILITRPHDSSAVMAAVHDAFPWSWAFDALLGPQASCSLFTNAMFKLMHRFATRGSAAFGRTLAASGFLRRAARAYTDPGARHIDRGNLACLFATLHLLTQRDPDDVLALALLGESPRRTPLFDRAFVRRLDTDFRRILGMPPRPAASTGAHAAADADEDAAAAPAAAGSTDPAAPPSELGRSPVPPPHAAAAHSAAPTAAAAAAEPTTRTALGPGDAATTTVDPAATAASAASTASFFGALHDFKSKVRSSLAAAVSSAAGTPLAATAPPASPKTPPPAVSTSSAAAAGGAGAVPAARFGSAHFPILAAERRDFLPSDADGADEALSLTGLLAFKLGVQARAPASLAMTMSTPTSELGAFPLPAGASPLLAADDGAARAVAAAAAMPVPMDVDPPLASAHASPRGGLSAPPASASTASTSSVAMSS
ncbi:hypothetical protein CXG81DRAFT_18845 [Caulochytrium protostelioides]|uniref:Uncharacterized protein n=1 Tax=Caulochytrium protostelioides TaxID=1555241 RepID=A0A4P9X7S9_9FUNG|nr:hypothetical protein CXG81DRAFT_18845 [Caulochytrium protostelioides]|eukprot:RKP01317.1 hypothetical protein CXG81DRAFT_18845 [Caulochytrium protostelioides]